ADDLLGLIGLGCRLCHLEPTVRAPQRDAPPDILTADARELVDKVDLDRIDAFDYDLTEFRTRYAYTPQNNLAGDYIAAELAGSGFAVTREKWLGASPQSLAAEDGLIAFSMASSHLFYSTDGGTTFAEYFPAGKIETWQNSACAVFPPETIHFAGDDTYYRTDDGGLTWSETQFDLGSESNYLSTMVFADADTGYLFSASGDVWRTEDSGSIWEEVGGTGMEIFAAACLPGDTRTVVGVSRAETVLRSADGGETWETVHDTPSGSTLYDVAFGDSDRGLAVGTADRLLITQDGGVTWTPSQIPGVDPAQQLLAVTGTGPLGFVVGSLYGEMYRTADGGESWETVTTGKASSVSALDWDGANGKVWLATKDGPAYADGELDGLTWRLEGIDPGTSILWENIIGEKTGTDYPVSYVYGTAHFDSISGRGEGDEDPYICAPGANDNGSGSATLLEMSRVLADYTPRRSLRLAFFNAEELGLHGSSHHARQLALEGVEVDGVINLDMVVWSDPPDVQEDLDVVTDYRSEWLADVLMESCTRYGDGLPGLKLIEPDFYRSDHAAFWLVGYPALLGIEDINVPYPDYHSYLDDYPTIAGHFPLTRQITRAALGALAGLVGIHDDQIYNLADIYAYPNPFRGDRHSGVTFNGLPPGSKLQVFDIAGNLVYETVSPAFELDWDVMNSSGAELAAGVYLYHVTAPGGDSVTAKLAVIR
ncbi:MAG: M28 family peptidase, partial [bacterium]|nr:M28 family peptidase [bacterium]